MSDLVPVFPTDDPAPSTVNESNATFSHETPDSQQAYVKHLERVNRKLTERLNRIRNLTPGRRRVWALDEVAMLMQMDADEMHGRAEVDDIDGLAQEADRCEGYALYLRRLEHDLSELRDAVRGEKRRMSRNDPRHWKGERP